MDDVTDILSRIESDLRQRSGEDDELARDEDKIKQRRAELRSEIGELQHLLDGLRKYAGIKITEPTISHVIPNVGTIAELAYAIVTANGGRMSVKRIIEELRLVGKLKGT